RGKSEDEARAPERIVVGHGDEPELQAAVERAAIVAERANRARDLSNMPPNELTPHTLGEQAQELAREHEHLTCEVLATRELDELGMGALTAVGRGSLNEPRLIVLRYDPPGSRGDTVLGLVGKSITFDAGGISIKPAGRMQDMKGDRAGGAGTLLALGDLYAGAFANDEQWGELIVEAGRRSGDLVWPFPLHPRYRRYIDSAFADLKNSSTLRQGSPALAAEFLHEFAGDGPWCHVD